MRVCVAWGRIWGNLFGFSGSLIRVVLPCRVQASVRRSVWEFAEPRIFWQMSTGGERLVADQFVIKVIDSMWEHLARTSRQWICALICMALFPCATRVSFSQDSPAPKAETKPVETGTPKRDQNATPERRAGDGVALPPAEIRYFVNKLNELVPVPLGAKLEQYLQFLEEKRGKSNRAQPATMTEVSILGDVDDDRANLKVTFTVVVYQSETFESIPLYFDEAVLKEVPVYTPGSKGLEQYYPKKDTKQDSKLGYIWSVRGQGQHRLECHFAVQLRKSLPSRQLVVTLPPSTVSRMQLMLPHPNVRAKLLSDQAVTDIRPTSDGRTSVEAIGLGSLLDLSWQPNVDVRSALISLEAQTAIRAHFEADHVLLQANQKINSLQGPFDEVTVRLPVGADLIKLDDPERHAYRIDPEDRQQVTVTFREKVSSAQLSWTLRLPLKLGKPITIDGFEVKNARKQVGKVGLSIAMGLRLSKPNDPSLVGINAGEFPNDLAIGLGTVVHAYQFFSQPFKLATTIDEVKPFFDVHPLLTLTATAQHLSLDAKFQYRVDRDSMNRDSMNEVVLTWPGFKSEGWTIESIEQPGVVDNHYTDDSGQITVRLIGYRSGVFTIHMRARRHFKPGDEILFTLPRPKLASRLSPTTLLLANAENVETDLMSRGETVFHPMSATNGDLKSLTESNRGLKSTLYQIDTDEQSFGLRVTPQKQRIHAKSFTEVRWQDNQFHVRQRLLYDVEYERLSQIRLTIPATLDPERVRFYSVLPDRDVELTPEWGQTKPGAGRQLLLKLGEARLGQFEILARYQIAFPKDSESSVRFPILTSVDEPFSQTRLSMAQSDWFDAEPANPEIWRPELNRQEMLKWMAEGSHDEVRINLVRSTHANESGAVSRSLIRIVIEPNGECSTRAQFRIATRSTSIPIQLPSSATVPAFFWDQRRLTEQECIESPAGSNRFLVQLPDLGEESPQTTHLLTVDYQDDIGFRMTWSDKLDLRAPQLMNCSWGQVYWQVVLPAGQHLLTYPRAAAPMFHWERSGLIWSRVSSHHSDTLQHWVVRETPGDAPAPDTLFSESIGNSYTFSQFDSPKPLVFHTLSSSMVLLLGAGFPLLVGFGMSQLAVLRNLSTLLVVGLIIATIGLWYSEPLELLIQPMVAGLLFPIVATLLHGSIRKQLAPTVVPFDHQSDFPPIHAFGSHYMIRQSDPNEATMQRPPVRDSESHLPIESGSGVS